MKKVDFYITTCRFDNEYVLFREHCIAEYDGETVMLYPKANLCSIDGVPITEPTKLPQGTCH